jgi:hypothetical protein
MYYVHLLGQRVRNANNQQEASSRARASCLLASDLEDGGSMFLQNVGKLLLEYAHHIPED